MMTKKVRRKRKTHVDPRVKAVAVELCSLYYAALRSAMGGRGVNLVSDYATMDGVSRRAFRRAAEASMQVGADAREYIVAQFQRWAEVSQLKGKVMIPMPTHLASLGAQARYIQYKLRKEARVERAAPRKETAHRAFFREERKLQGMTSYLRCMPEDVLTEQPEEFTREFLQHKMVWDLVQERWSERNA